MAERSLHLRASQHPNTLTARCGQVRMARVSGESRSSLAGPLAAGSESSPSNHVAFGGRLRLRPSGHPRLPAAPMM